MNSLVDKCKSLNSFISTQNNNLGQDLEKLHSQILFNLGETELEFKPFQDDMERLEKICTEM